MNHLLTTPTDTNPSTYLREVGYWLLLCSPNSDLNMCAGYWLLFCSPGVPYSSWSPFTPRLHDEEWMIGS